MIRRFFLLLIFITCLAVYHYSHAMEPVTLDPPTPLPVVVKLGFYLDDVLYVNETNETVRFVGTISAQWRDSRLAMPAGKGKTLRFDNDAALNKLMSIWRPTIMLVKNREALVILMRYLTITPQGVVTFRERVAGIFESHFELSHFPFDRQSVYFQLEPFMYSDKAIKLETWPQYEGIAPRARLDEWNVNSVTTQVKTVATRDLPAVSRYSFIVKFNREPLYYLWQVILPAIIISFLSFSVFWMVDTANALVSRVAISLTAVLTIVVFEWRIYERLPHISYHTYIDLLMTFSFVVVALTIPASVILHQLKKDHDRWTRICRWLFPVGYLVGVVLLILVFSWLD